jgi:hypothetical protein
MTSSEHAALGSQARARLLAHLTLSHRRFLIDRSACLASCGWLFDGRYRSLVSAYRCCSRPDWMEWLLHRLGRPVAPDVRIAVFSNTLRDEERANRMRELVPPAVVARLLRNRTRRAAR